MSPSQTCCSMAFERGSTRIGGGCSPSGRSLEGAKDHRSSNALLLTVYIPTRRSENHEHLPGEQMASDSRTREECEDSHFNE
jgi:hypothetical protein